MRVVITGATGFLGRPLAAALREAGHDVVALTRRADGRSGGREVVWQPDGTVGPWATQIDGAAAVINLAGESIAGARWTPARKALLLDSRTRSTRSIVAAIEHATHRPRVLLSASGKDYYGPRGAEPVTEADPPGKGFLASLTIEWERAASGAESLGVRVVYLRSGLVLERDGGALQQMLRPFRLGVGGPLGSGQQYWPWIHRADWIALVEFLLAHQGATGPVNATTPAPETNESFSRILASTLRRPCVFRVPAPALRLALGELADALLTGQRAIPARASALGFTFRYASLDDALRAILGHARTPGPARFAGR
jgi:uncharacterized protein (TIGR01777 family)